MKIAVIGTRGIPARYSGIETIVEDTSSGLKGKGYEFIIYCRKSSSSYPSNKIQSNVTLVHIPTLHSKHLGTLVHVFFSTFRVLFSDADIVHFHALGPSIFSFLPRLAGKKTVVTVHALDWKRRKWKSLARLFLRLCEYSAVYFPHKTAVISETLKEYFENKYKRDVYYIPNGVGISTADAQDTLRTDGRFMLTVARLTPEKGVHYLLAAFNELHGDVRLVIAGGSGGSRAYPDYLKSLASEKTEFAGFVQGDKLKELYKKAYLFILPSEVEGSSLSLLEAMSYGKCVLVSDIPENLEIIGDAGKSFASGDCADLTRQLQYLIDNPALVTAMGLKARKRVAERYDIKISINETENLYSSLFGINTK